MQSLNEARSILGHRSDNSKEMTTKLIGPSTGNEEEMSISRIPKSYHIVKTFPIFPKDFADKGYRVYNKEGLWNVVLWPSNNPDSREDVIFLSDAVRLMLDEIQGDISINFDPNSTQDVQKSKAYASHIMQLFDRRSSLLKVALDEITRQVSKHCTERGALLASVVENLFSTFKEIPNHYNVTLKILSKEIEQLKVALDAKNMELESQSKDLNEKIQLMALERRMEKNWHSQLEDQLKKWKQQIDNYKKKAQDQIQIERDMLEQQMKGLRNVINDLRVENDALKEQINFQRNEILKSEKKYAELDNQILSMKKKNEQLQIQISKSGNIPERPKNVIPKESIDKDSHNPEGVKLDFAQGSKLKHLLLEFPPQRNMPLLGLKDITQFVFGLLDQLYLSKMFIPFDDFYAFRLIIAEDSPQNAADSARAVIESLNQTAGSFSLSQFALDLLKRKYNSSLLKMIVYLFGFFRAQPFQGPIVLDPSNDVPTILLSHAVLMVQSMFSSILGDAQMKMLVDTLKSVSIEERGKEALISMVTVLDLTSQKLNEFFSKKSGEVQANFSRTFMRFQRSIFSKLSGVDTSIQRMDWRTFRDFVKSIRPELDSQEIESIFIEGTNYSDSCVSITADAFDTLCVSRQIYVNNISIPGSGKRLRYVPPDIITTIESAWKSSLRSAVKKAITELSKNDQSQKSVITLRSLDQRLEESLKNSSAGPYCVQMLHEAATIISSEAVSIASSLPIEKCLAITERQLKVIGSDDLK